MRHTDPLQAVCRYRTEIMGVAALWVWLFHEWTPVLGAVPVVSLAETFFCDIGFSGVDIFFFLSGLGLMLSNRNESVLSFYRRRFVRIWPPFFVTGLMVMAAEGWSLSRFLKNVTGLSFLFENLYLFLWFVPAIALLYLVFPLYRKGFEKSRNKALFLGCSLALWLMLSLAGKHGSRSDLYLFTNRIPVFFTGAAAGWLCREQKVLFSPLRWLVCFGGFAAGLVLSYLTNYRELYLLVPMSNTCVPTFLLAVCGCVLLGGFFSLTQAHTAPLHRFLAFYGSMSLEFYCVQEWLGEVLQPALAGKLPALAVNGIDFACATLAALFLKTLCKKITSRL